MFICFLHSLKQGWICNYWIFYCENFFLHSLKHSSKTRSVIIITWFNGHIMNTLIICELLGCSQIFNITNGTVINILLLVSSLCTNPWESQHWHWSWPLGIIVKDKKSPSWQAKRDKEIPWSREVRRVKNPGRNQN